MLATVEEHDDDRGDGDGDDVSSEADSLKDQILAAAERFGAEQATLSRPDKLFSINGTV